MNLLVLFPNQIFELSEIESLIKKKSIDNIILFEHPVFFGTDPEREINFNKMKLVLHRAAFYYYFDYLKKLKDVKIGHIKITEHQNIEKVVHGFKGVYYIDVPDYLVDKRMREIRKDVLKIEDIHPNFMLSRKDLDSYSKTKKGKYLHKHFYEWSRRKFNILVSGGKPVGGVYSYDKYNREGPPSDLKRIPSLPKINKIDKKYIEKAKKEIEKEFPKNLGNSDLYIPVSFDGAKNWFDDFLQNRLRYFGKYEDAVVDSEPFLYHSVISPLMNCGLLTPKYVIQKVLDYYEKHKKESDEVLYSVEGFIRQVLGWREWQRLIYLKEYSTLKNGNFYEHDRALTDAWYSGELGILPVDDTIKMGYKYAYLHHILRLMYMSNIMNLCRIHPHEMYYWFMSFSMDSYDWVMIQNVYGMGAFSDGGYTMTKPYITTGNYILKMSNYKKGKWSDLWSDLYYNFLARNIEKLEQFPRVSWMMLRNLNMKTDEEMMEISDSAEEFIEKITREYK